MGSIGVTTCGKVHREPSHARQIHPEEKQPPGHSKEIAENQTTEKENTMGKSKDNEKMKKKKEKELKDRSGRKIVVGGERKEETAARGGGRGEGRGRSPRRQVGRQSASDATTVNAQARRERILVAGPAGPNSPYSPPFLSMVVGWVWGVRGSGFWRS